MGVEYARCFNGLDRRLKKRDSFVLRPSLKFGTHSTRRLPIADCVPIGLSIADFRISNCQFVLGL